MISRQSIRHNAPKQILPQDSSSSVQMNKSIPQHHLVSNQISRPVGKSMGEEDKDSGKPKYYSKRSLKLSDMRSRRTDHLIVPKALDVQELTKDDRIITDRVYQHMRRTRLTNENEGYVSQATRRKEERIKNDRKSSVFGSLTSILGPEERSGKRSDRLTSRNKTTNVSSIDDDDCLALPKGRERQRTSALSRVLSSQKAVKSRRDQRQPAMGPLTSRLNSSVAPLPVSNDLSEKQVTPTKAAVQEGKPLAGRTQVPTRRTARISRRCVEKESKPHHSRGIPVSLTSASSNGGVDSASGGKVTSSDVIAIATSGTNSPNKEVLKIRNTSRTSSSSSVANKSGTEKQQITRDKPKTLRGVEKIHFDEAQVREEVRARLRKNQEKYETLSATTNPSKSEPTPSRVTPSSAAPTMPRESMQALATTSTSTLPVSTRTRLPKLKRSRTRKGRLQPPIKRIPETIPEENTLDFVKRERAKQATIKQKTSALMNKKISSRGKSKMPQSPKKAKASFYPRSPKSPGRRKQRFKVVTPHPIECAGSSKDSYGGLCMTFPIEKANSGEKNIKRIQGLMLVQ